MLKYPKILIGDIFNYLHPLWLKTLLYAMNMELFTKP